MTEAILSLILVALFHAVRFRHGLNMSDEGYLWNGTLRIGQGRIPIRDYKSYDPARFYWCHAWMRLFGPGILGLRHAAALYQALGLWAGLSTLSMVTGSVPLLALAGCVLVLWMQPRHKVFDHAQSLITTFFVATLLAAPGPGTAALAGIATGFAGFMGRNHGAYALMSTAGALILLALRLPGGLPEGAVPAWAGGIVLGYAPMLGMFLFVPDMARRYVHDKVLVFLRRRGIDLPRAAPLPWRAGFAGLSPLDRASRLATGLHFPVVPLVCLGVLGWALLAPGLPQGNPAPVAGALAGLFYMHHSLSRSDVPHLCQATQPFLVGLMALILGGLAAPLAAGALAALAAVAWLVVRQIDARLQCLEDPGAFVATRVRGDRLMVRRSDARLLDTVTAFAETHMTPEDRIFIAPDRATLYPVLGRAAPVRSDMMIFPETEAAQDQVIADLERGGVDWALTQDRSKSGQDELRFSRTHAKVWDYLERRFDPVPCKGLKPHWTFWQRHRQEKP